MPQEMKAAIDELVESRNAKSGGPLWSTSAVVRRALEVYFKSLNPTTHPELIPDGFGKGKRDAGNR